MHRPCKGTYVLRPASGSIGHGLRNIEASKDLPRTSSSTPRRPPGEYYPGLNGQDEIRKELGIAEENVQCQFQTNNLNAEEDGLNYSTDREKAELLRKYSSGVSSNSSLSVEF